MFSLPPLPRTLDACERDLDSPKLQVRLSVAKDLGRGAPTEDTRRVSLLSRCLSDQDTSVRKQALISIADLRLSTLRDRVLSLLCDPELEVRQMAVLSLGEITEPDDTEVIGRLAGLLKAGAPSIRYQALLAYCNLRPEKCEPDLRSALFDEDSEVRKLALRLIDEVLLGRNLPLPEEMARLLVRMSSDDDAHVALLAQLVCGELGLVASRTRLIDVVDRRLRVTEPRDEQWSVELCGRLQIKGALVGLRRRAYGLFGFSTDSFRWVALGALARMGDELALGRLVRHLQSRSYMHRVLAVQALGRSAQKEALFALSQHHFKLSQSVGDGPADEREQVDLALGDLKTELEDAI